MTCYEQYFMVVMDIDSYTFTTEDSPEARGQYPAMVTVGRDVYAFYRVNGIPKNADLSNMFSIFSTRCIHQTTAMWLQ